MMMEIMTQVGNLFRGSIPPRTAWVARVEYDHVLVPQDVDAALERFECYDDDMTTMMMMRTMSSFHRTLTRH